MEEYKLSAIDTLIVTVSVVIADTAVLVWRLNEPTLVSRLLKVVDDPTSWKVYPPQAFSVSETTN